MKLAKPQNQAAIDCELCFILQLDNLITSKFTRKSVFRIRSLHEVTPESSKKLFPIILEHKSLHGYPTVHVLSSERDSAALNIDVYV